MQTARSALTLVASHAALIALALAYIAAVSGPTIGANIGLGMGIMALAGPGLPWSATYLFGGLDGLRVAGSVAVLASFALLNLVLHAVFWIVVLGRQATKTQNGWPAGSAKT